MKRLLISILLGSLLIGCASTKLSERVESKADKTNTEATKLLKDANAKIIDPKPVVEHSNQAWFAGKAVISKKQALNIPDSFSRPITLERYMTIQEAAERITIKTGIPVQVDSSLINNTSQGASSPVATTTAPSTSSTSSNSNNSNQIFNIRYTGTVYGLLDTISARMGFNWKYENNQIRFFTLETRTFVLHAIPGDSALANAVGSNVSSSGGSSSASSGGSGITGTGSTGGGGGNSNASSSQMTSVNSTLSVWTNINDTVLSMLSARGKVITSQSTGTITVTDKPEILERVASYIDGQNKNLSKQVFVNVKIFSVALSETDNYSLNWNAVFNNLSKQFGLSLVNNFPSVAGATTLTAQILSTSTGNVSQFAGSDAMLSALSSQGKVAIVTSATVTALNNQPTPIQVGRQISYLQSSSTTQTPNVGSTTSLIPGVINTGFSMNVLPHILEGDKLLLQYAIDISSLSRINTVTSNGSSIQTPEIDTRNFLSRIGMKSGQTLVLSGFEQAADNLDRSGVAEPKLTPLGGTLNANATKSMIVVVITPISTEGI